MSSCWVDMTNLKKVNVRSLCVPRMARKLTQTKIVYSGSQTMLCACAKENTSSTLSKNTTLPQSAEYTPAAKSSSFWMGLHDRKSIVGLVQNFFSRICETLHLLEVEPCVLLRKNQLTLRTAQRCILCIVVVKHNNSFSAQGLTLLIYFHELILLKGQ